jgi:hypothetical protein
MEASDLYISLNEERSSYLCIECNKVSSNQSTMYYHVMKDHLKTCKFECNHCATNFLQKSLYLKHLATVHPKTPHPSKTEKNPYVGIAYQCGGCEHTSTTKGNCLIHYARTHASWIPVYKKKESCTGCKLVFASSTAYLHHALQCFPVPEDKKKELELISEVKTAPPA